jgi:hypothetical protein
MMDLSTDKQNLSNIETRELKDLRDDLVGHPVVQRVIERVREDAESTPSGHTSHSSHSTHNTHSSGWASPKR